MKNPKFCLFKSTKNGQYYYHLQAFNGEKILSGEGYISKQSCREVIGSIKANAPFERSYERKNAVGNNTFNLKARNGEVIGRSENYTSEAARENGIAAVKHDSQNAEIEDNT